MKDGVTYTFLKSLAIRWFQRDAFEHFGAMGYGYPFSVVYGGSGAFGEIPRVSLHSWGDNSMEDQRWNSVCVNGMIGMWVWVKMIERYKFGWFLIHVVPHF